MNYKKLKAELDKPKYKPLTDRAAASVAAGNVGTLRESAIALAAELNAKVTMPIPRTRLTVASFVAAIDAAEYAGLTPAKAGQVAGILAMVSGGAKPADVIRIATAVFGAGPTTASLQGNEDIETIEARKVGVRDDGSLVRPWHIERALMGREDTDDE